MHSISKKRKRLIETACEEIEMVRRLIETNIHKYENIIEVAGEIDIYSLDQACGDVDRTIRYIRKIIIVIPSIVEKMKEENRKKRLRKRLDEIRRKSLRKRTAIQNFLDKKG